MNPPAWLYDTTPAHRRNIVGQWSWFGLWAVTTVIGGFVLKPDSHLHGTHTQLGLPKCYSVILWDRPCPGCGLTTSWTATMHGNFPLAFEAHSLGPIMYGLFTLTALLCAFGSIKGWRLRSDTKLATASLTAAIVIFIVYGAIRFANTTYNDPGHKIWAGVQKATPNR